MDIGSLAGRIEIEDQLTGVLSSLTYRVQQFGDAFDGMVGGIAVGAGAATLAISGVTAAVIGLGKRGSDVNDVANTMRHFAGGADEAEAALEKLRQGTLNTVDDMALMEKSSQLLAAGVRLTSKDFGTLGSSAFILQNQGLGPTKDMLDLVSQALLTGRTRALEMRIGKLDLSHAEEMYALSLGVSKDQLDASSQLEAKRIGILEALNRKVQEAGAQQRDFGEMLEAGTTWLRNWFDTLASSVASSPRVLAAVTSIQTAIERAFGGTSQSLLEWVVDWVNRFAGAVSTYGPPVIEAFGWIYNRIRDIWKAVMDAWNAVPDWLKNIARDAALAGAALYVAGKATSTVQAAISGLSGEATTTGLRSIVSEWSTITDATISVGRLFKETLPASIAATGAAFTASRAAVNVFAESMSAAAGASATLLAQLGTGAVVIGATAAVATAGWQAWKLWSENAERANAAARQATTDQSNLERLNTALGSSYTSLNDAVEAWKEHVESLPPKVAVLTAEEQAAAEAARIHAVEVDKLFSIFSSAAAKIDVTSEAFEKLSISQRISRETQALVIPLLNDHIAKNIALTKTEKDYYDMVVASRLNQEAYNLTLLAAQNVSLDRIRSLQAMSLSEAEIAQKLGTTVVALQQYTAYLSRLKTLTDELATERIKMSGTAADVAAAGYQKEYEAAVQSLDKTSIYYAETMAKLAALRNARTEAEGSSWSTIAQQSQEALLQMAEAAERDYQRMLDSGLRFTHEALEAQWEKTRELYFEAYHMGQSYEDAGKRITESAERSAESMNELAEATWEAKRAADAMQSFSFDVTKENFESMLSSFGKGGMIDQATKLARLGYSFQQILAVLSGGPLPSNPGPRIPGFAEGGIVKLGEGGTEVVRLPFGSQVYPHSAAALPGQNQTPAVFNFYVNGTAEEVARKIGDELMKRWKFERSYGSAS